MTATWIFLGVLVLLGAVAYFYFRPEELPEVPSEVGDYHFHLCDGCGKQLRYRASKAGCAARCPGCGQRWILPNPSKAVSPAANGYQLT
jgi:hypothetical protein